jgi:hypothetical protein
MASAFGVRPYLGKRVCKGEIALLRRGGGGREQGLDGPSGAMASRSRAVSMTRPPPRGQSGGLTTDQVGW